MATKKLRLGLATPDKLFLGAGQVRKAFIGSNLFWDVPAFVDEPKIDPDHPLANRVQMTHLTNGALEGATVVSGTATIVDNAFASATPGTLVMARNAFPAANNRTFRVSALIKIDKTAGRYSRVGFASNTGTATTSTPDIYVGHAAGAGIVMGSVNFAISLQQTVLDESKLVDGAWYRVSVIYDNVLDRNTGTTNTGKARVMAAAEPVDPANNPAVPWYPLTVSSRHNAGSYTPMALVARTNSALGTIRSLRYVDSMLGATDDDAPINDSAKMGSGTDSSDVAYLWSKGKAAPLRVIVAAGGSGVYGGMDFAHGAGRTGHPYDAFRKFWRDLSDLGYTVLHTKALHEGWGADDHLTKQLEALNLIKSEFGTDVRLYYIGYSMGGISLWRAIRGRAGFPNIRAAYSIAGICDLDRYYDVPMFVDIKTRWPVRSALDEATSYAPADLWARGTRVRMVTSTGDTNVPKTIAHDPMKAKYVGAPEGLWSELVHDGIDHFDPTYWNAEDCVAFFEGADL